MALTQEQIKNLKPGDTIFLNNYPLTFRASNIHGDVLANDNVAECNEGGICWFSKNYLSIDNATPKHDPCRLFKKGDRVKTRSVFGRKIYIDDVLYEVMWDESCNKISVKDLTSAETLVGMPSVFFELVTPVEELEPYSVVDAHTHWDVADKDMKTVATYSKLHHPNAKEAAEAERDRLNAEYRKERENG